MQIFKDLQRSYKDFHQGIIASILNNSLYVCISLHKYAHTHTHAYILNVQVNILLLDGLIEIKLIIMARIPSISTSVCLCLNFTFSCVLVMLAGT